MKARMILIAFLAICVSSCTLIQDVPTLLPQMRIEQGDDRAPTAPNKSLTNESPRPESEINIPPTWTPAVEIKSGPPNLSVSTPLPAAAQGQQTYIVQTGDTLGEIATKFNLSIDELAQANGITDFDHIEAGQVLVIPGR